MLFYIGLTLLILGIYYNYQVEKKIETIPSVTNTKKHGLIKTIHINVKNLDGVTRDYTTNDMRKYYIDMDGYHQLDATYDNIYSDMFNKSNISKSGLGLNETPPDIFYL